MIDFDKLNSLYVRVRQLARGARVVFVLCR